MAKTDFKSVGAYIASHPVAVQRILKRVRSTIRKAVPNAEETISYGMPTYKLHGRPLIYFSGWKRHYSLYPSTLRLAAAFKDELAPYEVDKGHDPLPPFRAGSRQADRTHREVPHEGSRRGREGLTPVTRCRWRN